MTSRAPVVQRAFTAARVARRAGIDGLAGSGAVAALQDQALTATTLRALWNERGAG